MLSFIADIVGIISFFVSFLIYLTSRTILKDVTTQRTEYHEERFQLQTSLIAFTHNIRDDLILTNHIKSELRRVLYTYKQKYIAISSLTCLFHLWRSLRIVNKSNINTRQKHKLLVSLDFLIARFNKKEIPNG